MGNCQAIDAAVLVIQHPQGRLERMYWPVQASEVMRSNPGHHVSLILPLPVSQQDNQNIVKFTRVKLLRSGDTLHLGHAYRLVPSQEVKKILEAKKCAKMKKHDLESQEVERVEERKSTCEAGKQLNVEISRQAIERHQPRAASSNSASMRLRTWRPSLQSISETGVNSTFEHNNSTKSRERK